MTDIRKLQDGNRITGTARETDGAAGAELSKEAAGRIAGAFCYVLSQKVQKNPVMLNVAVGCDPRLSGAELKEGVMEAIGLWGANGFDAGLAASPAMFMSTVLPQFEIDGAVMITAGELPPGYNGFRFFTAKGSFDEEDVAEVLRLAARYTFIGGPHEEQALSLMPFYAAYLRQMITQGLADMPGYLSGMHIVVDGGSGSAGFLAEKVLKPLGADISGSYGLEPDGSFPGRGADPCSGDALEGLCRAVRESGADLGIAFDAGCEKAAAASPGGVPIARNEMIALAAAIAADDCPGGTVVTDSVTSKELASFLEKKLKLRQLRFRSGSADLIRKAQELCAEGENAFLAAETTGMTACRDNSFVEDGIFLAVQIIINAARLRAKGKDISALLNGLKSPAESRELKLKITAEDFRHYGTGVLEDLEKWAEYSDGIDVVRPNYEGVRVSFNYSGVTGWFQMRLSPREPVMLLSIESEEGGADIAAAGIGRFLEDYRKIEWP